MTEQAIVQLTEIYTILNRYRKNVEVSCEMEEAIDSLNDLIEGDEK